MTKNKSNAISWRHFKRSLKDSFKFKKRKVKARTERDSLLQNQVEMQTGINWERALDDLIDREKIADQDGWIWSLDKDLGFGYLSSEDIEAKVVLQGSNPFMDNHVGSLNPSLGNFVPYSQVYNVNSRTNNESSFLILR